MGYKVKWKEFDKIGTVVSSIYCTGMDSFKEVLFEDGTRKYLSVHELEVLKDREGMYIREEI